MKKFNEQTKCYKIDIYKKAATGYKYVCSTDMSKTCKIALIRFFDAAKIPINERYLYKANFYQY